VIGMTSLNQCWGLEGCISSLEPAARNVSVGTRRLAFTCSLPTQLAYKGGTMSHIVRDRGQDWIISFDIFL
jgi:hypothetical protein